MEHAKHTESPTAEHAPSAAVLNAWRVFEALSDADRATFEAKMHERPSRRFEANDARHEPQTALPLTGAPLVAVPVPGGKPAGESAESVSAAAARREAARQEPLPFPDGSAYPEARDWARWRVQEAGQHSAARRVFVALAVLPSTRGSGECWPSVGGFRMLHKTDRVFRTEFSRSYREFEEILPPCRETTVFRQGEASHPP